MKLKKLISILIVLSLLFLNPIYASADSNDNKIKPTPTITPTAIPTATAAPTIAVTPTVAPTMTPTPTASPTATITPNVTAPPTITVAPTTAPTPTDIITAPISTPGNKVVSQDNLWTYLLAGNEAVDLKPNNDQVRSGNIVIPKTIDGHTVVSIAASAFDQCTNLISVELPDSITAIGDHAFSSCYSLTTVILRRGLAVIGEAAFSYTSLQSVIIPNTVLTIGLNAFLSCNSLTEIKFLSKTTAIDPSASTISSNGNAPFTIYGRDSSTAKAYADANHYAFSQLTSTDALNTDMLVNAEATIIDVVINPVFTVEIDPNNGRTIETVDISVENNTTAPIIVTSNQINNESKESFHFVSPDTNIDWTQLTKEQSKNIAVKLETKSGWKNVAEDGHILKTDTNGCVGKLCGTIRPYESAYVTASLLHGNSFAVKTSSTFSINWSISLE